MMKRAPASSLRCSLKYCVICSASVNLNGETQAPTKKSQGGAVVPLRGSTSTRPSFMSRKQPDQRDRVEVEGGLGEAPVAILRVIAGEREDVAQAHSLQGVAARDGAVARDVLAREVDDAVQAGVLDLLRQLVGHDGVTAARVVGEAHGVHATVSGEVGGVLEERIDAATAGAGGGHRLQGHDELAPLQRRAEAARGGGDASSKRNQAQRPGRAAASGSSVT